MGELISALVRDELSVSRPILFTPGERVPSTHRIGGWIGSGTDLDDVEKENVCPYRDSNSDFSAVLPVAIRYTDHANSNINYLKFLTFNKGNLNFTACSI
jgi:hypothetical protein